MIPRDYNIVLKIMKYSFFTVRNVHLELKLSRKVIGEWFQFSAHVQWELAHLTKEGTQVLIIDHMSPI